MTTDWSSLPADLLSIVAGELDSIADLARFRLVCPQWRAAAAAVSARPQFLCLLLSPGPLDGDRRRFLHLAENQPYTVIAPESLDRSVFASFHGWMLAVEKDGRSTSLLHPFTGAVADLPSLPSSARADDVDRRLAWDWSPHGVMVSLGPSGLFFCREGDTAWMSLSKAEHRRTVSRINYHDGAFYVLEGESSTDEANMFRTTIIDAESLAVRSSIPAPPAAREAAKYLDADVVVASDTELLLLLKPKWPCPFRNRKQTAVELPIIFRSDRLAGTPQWSEATSVGDRAIFVDSLHTLAVDGAKLSTGFKQNCIYSVTTCQLFSLEDRDWVTKHSVSVTDLCDRSLRKWPCKLMNGGSKGGCRKERPPFWILPELR